MANKYVTPRQAANALLNQTVPGGTKKTADKDKADSKTVYVRPSGSDTTSLVNVGQNSGPPPGGGQDQVSSDNSNVSQGTSSSGGGTQKLSPMEQWTKDRAEEQDKIARDNQKAQEKRTAKIDAQTEKDRKKREADEKQQKKDGKAQTKAQNAQTKASVTSLRSQLEGNRFARNNANKFATTSYKASDGQILKAYGAEALGLVNTIKDNDKAEGDASYSNITNTLRERSDTLSELAIQGAGETDQLKALMSTLRNYDANQNEINRSFFDTLRSANRAITTLNTKTGTERVDSWNQLQDTKWQNQREYADAQGNVWTNIGNTQNANQNLVKTDWVTKYKPTYAQDFIDGRVNHHLSNDYTYKAPSTDLNKWSGQAVPDEKRRLNSSSAPRLTLKEPMKKAEGAALRKWK